MYKLQEKPMRPNPNQPGRQNEQPGRQNEQPGRNQPGRQNNPGRDKF